MADDQNTDKKQDLLKRGLLAGTIKFPKHFQKYLDKHPRIKEKVLGDIERRKLEIDTTLAEIERLQRIENSRLKNAKLAVESAEGAYTLAIRSGDEIAIQNARANLDTATKAALPDMNINQQLTSMQNRAISLMRGEDIPETSDSVQLGNRSYNKADLESLRTDPAALQETINTLQTEAEAGNTQSQADAEALAEYFADVLPEDILAQEQDEGFLPQAQTFVEERVTKPVANVVQNIQERLFGVQNDQSRAASPSEPTEPEKAVEATRRQSLEKRIRQAQTIRIHGNKIETE